ncbi:hypothetical protein DFH27DRAFT_607178 [Peziza echinospora]|nr:hypothetical protein DFH27DRAFT_607178 [Peziza echinospora]
MGRLTKALPPVVAFAFGPVECSLALAWHLARFLFPPRCPRPESCPADLRSTSAPQNHRHQTTRSTNPRVTSTSVSPPPPAGFRTPRSRSGSVTSSPGSLQLQA